MNSILARIALLAALTSTAACGASTGSIRPVRTASPDFATTIAAARQTLRDAPAPWVGAAVAVMHDGEMVWLEGFGHADREGTTPVDPRETPFRIYSVVKPMTATAAARQMERRLVDPAAPVQRYLPDFPEKAAPITLMDLATHRSGIRHYADDAEAGGTRRCATVADALEIFGDDPLVHSPGAAETYSSWGFVLLGAVVESVAQKSFTEAIDELVFAPAGMTRTAPEVPGSGSYYEEMDGLAVPARTVDNSCKWGAGGFVATAEDVARFGAAFLGGSLLSSPSLQLFFQGDDVYRAQGVGIGGTAFLVVDAANDLSIALLSNTSGETAGPWLQAFLGNLHEQVVASIRARPPA